MTKNQYVIPILTIIVVSFTLANLGLTLSRGALAMSSIYDDNTYLLDAYKRLAFEGVDTVFGALVSFYHTPPHSPFSTTVAMVGYYLFGGEDIGPYALNFISLAVYAFSLYAIASRRIGSVLWTTALMFVPAAGTLITEFRPDATAALLFALSAYLLIFLDYEKASYKEISLVGLVCLLAICVKPSAIIIVFPMLSIAFLAGALKKFSLISIKKISALPVFVLLGFMIFSFIWGSHIIAYLHQVFVSNADVWVTPGNGYFHWTYNSFGAAGKLALNYFFFIGAIFIVLDAFFKIYKRDYFNTSIIYYAWVIIIYAGIAVNPQKSPYQGNFFYFPFIIAFTVAGTGLLRGVSYSRWLVGCWAIFSALYLPPAFTYQDASQRPESLQMLSQIRNAIVSSRCNGAVSLASLGPYPIPPETIALRLAKEKIDLSINPLFLVREQNEFMQRATSATFIVIPNVAGKLEGDAQRLPGMQHISPLLSQLQSDPSWRRVEISAKDPSAIYINTRQCSYVQT